MEHLMRLNASCDQVLSAVVPKVTSRLHMMILTDLRVAIDHHCPSLPIALGMTVVKGSER